ncbi:FecR family protein [Desertivirga xinjiangensis]|uniref:FecR family protein n=1 Tax=Desertivirga xinjiangensis TaxID=539206 RepID=UPI00210F0B64|nr:FecR domain-containing protein [Pedobacter xinjiangensis]
MKKTLSNKKHLQQIAKKILDGSASPEERAFFEAFYNNFDKQEIDSKAFDEIDQKLRKNILAHITSEEPQPAKVLFIRPLRKLRLVAAAIAGFLIISSIALYYYSHIKADGQHFTNNTSPLIPAKDKAILVLEDGREVELDSTEIDISKIAVSDVLNQSSSSGQSSAGSQIQFNSVYTAPASTYNVILSDGTHVWLNARSRLRYPGKFSGDERKVELEGEAYFEVAKQYTQQGEKIPFKVITGTQEVEVLGTEFNINSYSQGRILTTLISGSVRLNDTRSPGSSILLKPLQQAEYQGASFKTRQANPEKILAWKNGVFHFDNQTIEEIMEEVSDWYQVDFTIDDQAKRERFTGILSRYNNIESLVNKLRLTNSLTIEIKGREVSVTK